MNDLKCHEADSLECDDIVESPRRKIISFSGEKSSRPHFGRRGRPSKVHEDWLRSNGKTLSFVDNEGVVTLTMSPPKQTEKGDCIMYVQCVYYLLVVVVSRVDTLNVLIVVCGGQQSRHTECFDCCLWWWSAESTH